MCWSAWRDFQLFLWKEGLIVIESHHWRMMILPNLNAFSGLASTTVWLFTIEFQTQHRLFFFIKLWHFLFVFTLRWSKQQRPRGSCDQLQLPAVWFPLLHGPQCRRDRGGAAAASLSAQPLHPQMLHPALHLLSTGAVSATETLGGGKEKNETWECLLAGRFWHPGQGGCSLEHEKK